jgi:hypothetical protein
MKFTAELIELTAAPCLAPPLARTVEARHELDAARQIAEWAARAAFGPEGVAPMVARVGEHAFNAFIGCAANAGGAHATIRITFPEKNQ